MLSFPRLPLLAALHRPLWSALSLAAGAALAQTPAAMPPTTGFTGTAWHVDAVAGDDANPGTADAPFRTLARAGRLVMARGDALLLRCGAVFRESLQLTPVQAPMGAPTVGIYGDCHAGNRPVVDGSDPVVATWTPDSRYPGKPVYTAPWTTPVRTLYWNGAPMVRARYPNYGGIGKEFALVGSGLSATFFTLRSADLAALKGLNLAGADVRVRSKPYIMESSKVRSFDRSLGWVTLDVGLKQQLPYAGTGFFFEGHAGLIDTPGEWHWDAATGQLTVWTPDGAEPSTGLLESVRRANGLEVLNVADARVEQIVFDRQFDNGLLFTGASRALASKVLVRRSDGNGIQLRRWTYDGGDARVEDSELADTARASLVVTTPRAVLARNLVRDNGLGTRGAGEWSAAVKLGAESIQFVDNRIVRTSSMGLSLGDVPGVLVQGNEVDRPCMRLSDCGGIYVWGQTTSPLRKLITSNYVHDLVANPEGAIGGAPRLVVGLYVDYNTRNVDLRGNFVVRAGLDVATGLPAGDGVGIYVSASANNTVDRNKVWLVTKASIQLHGMLNTAGEMLRGNAITGNLLYAGGFNVTKGTTTSFVPARALLAYHDRDPYRIFAGDGANSASTNTTATFFGPAGQYWAFGAPAGVVPFDLAGWGVHARSEKLLAPYAAVLKDPAFVQTRESTMLVNPGAQAKTIQCAETVLRDCRVTNLSGGSISFPYTLAPRSALAIVSADPRWLPLR